MSPPSGENEVLSSHRFTEGFSKVLSNMAVDLAMVKSVFFSPSFHIQYASIHIEMPSAQLSECPTLTSSFPQCSAAHALLHIVVTTKS